MDKKSEQSKNFDSDRLLSFMSCVRNEAHLNTQLFWKTCERQLSFSAFLVVGFGLLFSISEYLGAIIIATMGVLSSLLLLGVARVNELHADEYNESYERLERHLPKDLESSALIWTYDKKIKPELKLRKFRARPKIILPALTVLLVVFWLTLGFLSVHQVYQKKYDISSQRFEEVLPIPKHRNVPKKQNERPKRLDRQNKSRLNL